MIAAEFETNFETVYDILRSLVRILRLFIIAMRMHDALDGGGPLGARRLQYKLQEKNKKMHIDPLYGYHG